MYLVYILQSDKYSYVGMTNNFLQRWMQHNQYISGGAKYTKKYDNWTPICIIDGFKNKSEAMQCEWKLKTRRMKSSYLWKGPMGRIQYLNILLSNDKWTSNSPFIKDQYLQIYIVDKYKQLLKFPTRELYWF